MPRVGEDFFHQSSTLYVLGRINEDYEGLMGVPIQESQCFKFRRAFGKGDPAAPMFYWRPRLIKQRILDHLDPNI